MTIDKTPITELDGKTVSHAYSEDLDVYVVFTDGTYAQFNKGYDTETECNLYETY